MTDKIQVAGQIQTGVPAQKQNQNQQIQTNPYMTSIFNQGTMNQPMMNELMGGFIPQIYNSANSMFGGFGMGFDMQNMYNSMANCFNFDFSKINYSQYGAMPNMPNYGAANMPNYGNPSFGGLTGNQNQYGGQQVVSSGSLPVEHQVVISELQALGIKSTGDFTKDSDALTKAEKVENTKKREASDICNGLYDAMKGAGTKNDKLKEFVSKINKDNVLDVMDIWNANFANDMDGETLIASISGECYGGWFSNQQKDLTTHIQKALKSKSEELGLNAEAAAFDSKVTTENNSWWNTEDDVIIAHFDDMYAKAANAENEQKAKKVVIAQNSTIPATKK